MAVWLYQDHRVKLRTGMGEDEQIRKVLQDFGKRGWELVQMIPEKDPAEVQSYWLIFKAEKQLISGQTKKRKTARRMP